MPTPDPQTPAFVRLPVMIDGKFCGAGCRGIDGYRHPYDAHPAPVGFICQVFGEVAVYADQDDDTDYTALRHPACLYATAAEDARSAVSEAARAFIEHARDAIGQDFMDPEWEERLDKLDQDLLHPPQPTEQRPDPRAAK